MRRVDVELHGQPLGHEVLLGEGAGQLDPVRRGQLAVGRQRQHDLARDLAVLPAFRRLGRVPQHGAVGEPRIGPLRQQHLVVFRRVAVAEVEQLARPLGLDRLAGVVGRGPHGVAAGGAGQVAGAGRRWPW